MNHQEIDGGVWLQEGDLSVPKGNWRSKPGARHYYFTIISDPFHRAYKDCRRQHAVLECFCGKRMVRRLEVVLRKGSGATKSCGCQRSRLQSVGIQKNEPLRDGKKRCNECQNLLDASCFAIDSDKRDGLYTLCQTCVRGKNLLKAYGITLADYEEMVTKQEDKCDCCGTPKEKVKLRHGVWYVDHCHVTKKVRGLVCMHCNIMLGHAFDSEERLEMGILYLQKTQDEKAHMKLPPGVTESQVLEAIENAVRILSPSFTFGIYDLEDVKQEARMEGLRVIDRYDAARPLDNFMYTCIRNRLIRLKRDKLRRNDPPCLLCHHAEGNRSQHEDGTFCQTYVNWRKRNEAKANLMRPLDIDHVTDRNEQNSRRGPDVGDEAGTNEMIRLIDEKLDVDLRSTYLQMRAGKGVPKTRRAAVEKAVKEILKGCLGEDDA